MKTPDPVSAVARAVAAIACAVLVAGGPRRSGPDAPYAMIMYIWREQIALLGVGVPACWRAK